MCACVYENQSVRSCSDVIGTGMRVLAGKPETSQTTCARACKPVNACQYVSMYVGLYEYMYVHM